MFCWSLILFSGLLKFCTVGFCGIGTLIDFILIAMQVSHTHTTQTHTSSQLAAAEEPPVVHLVLRLLMIYAAQWRLVDGCSHNLLMEEAAAASPSSILLVNLLCRSIRGPKGGAAGWQGINRK